MTRGQIAIIYKGYNEKEYSVMTSIEFNGDMYMPTKKWAGHGQQVINLLKKVNDVANYQYAVAKFNNDHHHYCDCERLTYKTPRGELSQKMLDFSKDYFENWFSDYVYIKNITDETIDIVVEQRNKDGDVLKTPRVAIFPNEIIVLCFGAIVKRVQCDE